MKTQPPAARAIDEADRRWMRAALALARRGAGRTWPNPNVGCILVRDGRVVGRGWTQPGGRPHAEAVALAQAGKRAAGATAYVTLEPCAHHGRTPPCAEALVAAGIAACAIGTGDPDPRVSGGGIAALEAAGIPVLRDVCAEAARWAVRGFLSRVERGRPWLTCKLATSLDGRIAAADGSSQWITGPAARAHGHLLRASHDAILVGSGTLRSDDPLLTCRLPGLEDRSPLRLVMASGRDLPLQRRLFAPADGSAPPVWLLHGRALAAADAAELDRRGIQRIALDCDTVPPPDAALRALAERGLTHILLEGGAGLATAFLQAGLIDSLAWYRAARVLGDGGLPALAALAPVDLAAAPDWRLHGSRRLDADVLETFVRAG